MGFVEITGPEYTALLVRRLRGEVPELTWLRQFRALLQPLVRLDDLLLDVGCATGYAFNSFRNLGVRYLGVDIEETYLDIARGHFAEEPRARFIQHDVTAAPLPERAAIVTTCATLEHFPSLQPALDHLAGAAERVLLMRAFLGEREVIETMPSKVPEFRDRFRKPINQYAFRDVLGFLEGRGFRTRVYVDDYYSGAPQLIEGNIVRTFWVVLAERVGA